ncbi:hypothetical protein IF2G_06772 [Cordyceps javanica]|nr:hypothetical protein IF2G_06772 [Cordyceps javanica]
MRWLGLQRILEECRSVPPSLSLSVQPLSRLSAIPGQLTTLLVGHYTKLLNKSLADWLAALRSLIALRPPFCTTSPPIKNLAPCSRLFFFLVLWKLNQPTTQRTLAARSDVSNWLDILYTIPPAAAPPPLLSPRGLI